MKVYSKHWLSSLFDEDNISIAANNKEDKVCRSLRWIEEAGGIKYLMQKLNTN